MSQSSSFGLPPAGPSSFEIIRTNSPPPPGTIERDDYAAADQARQRFNKHGLFSSVSLPSLNFPGRNKSKSTKRASSPSPVSVAELEGSTVVPQEAPELINLAEDHHLSAALDEDYDKDVYRWAILYENQRGATFFSTPYYSPLTLLPLDPPPFTIPNASRCKDQPTVSLEDYLLPDGSWKWVSRAWMIDMRGDGQVQYDGFEYSRSFRSKKWGPNPGPLSTRGLVRRRRWLRLMMRPAQVHQGNAQSKFSAPGGLSTLPELEHNEEGATRPPSVILTVSNDSDDTSGIWQGSTKDWDRCHAALLHLGRDGRKLELWAHWLGVPDKFPNSRPSSMDPVIGPSVTVGLPEANLSCKQAESSPQQLSSGDEKSLCPNQTETGKLAAEIGINISKAPKDYVAAVIRAHGSDILNLFVYPDSRARFLMLLDHVGLLPDLREGIGLGVSDSVQILDFWSYTQDLDSAGVAGGSYEP